MRTAIGVVARFYCFGWRAFRALTLYVNDGATREDLLSVFGPLSFLALVAIWVCAIVLCFAAIHWAAGLTVQGRPAGFADSLFHSGTTLSA